MKSNDSVMLSEAARRELRAERERALKQRDHHADEAKRWDALLSRIDGLLAAANGAKHSAPATENGPDLWPAVVAVLREHEAGLKPVEVTGKLVTRGFRATGSTPLPLLVSNLLWRRAKAKHGIERTRKGAYRLVPIETAAKEATP
ncbi:MAG: hypothetical protein HY560_05025 [Gemmatimonadetes bacterium]|nr:hypothetical protein [Gemmatimonadota bacterium]